MADYAIRKVKVTTSDTGHKLEAAVYCPNANSQGPLNDIGVVVTHPMPLLGGSMHNNVVYGISEYFARKGATVIRFNFRGVGKSEGSGSWRGGTEQTDVKDVRLGLLDNLVDITSIQSVQYAPNSLYKSYILPPEVSNYLCDEFHVKRVLLIGYSYGSAIAGAVTEDIPNLLGFAALSYPFGPLWFMGLWPCWEKLKRSRAPKFFFIGDSDDFTSAKRFKDRMESMENVKFEIVEGLDHWYIDHEARAAESIFKWAVNLLGEKKDESPHEAVSSGAGKKSV